MFMSDLMVINLAWLNPFISPKSSMLHMSSTITNSSRQTGEVTPEKLMERQRINGEEDGEMAIIR